MNYPISRADNSSAHAAVAFLDRTDIVHKTSAHVLGEPEPSTGGASHDLADTPRSGLSLRRVEWAARELEIVVQDAHRGDASAARRAAELLELLCREQEAVEWWHRAAAAGDPDAALYVRRFLTQ